MYLHFREVLLKVNPNTYVTFKGLQQKNVAGQNFENGLAKDLSKQNKCISKNFLAIKDYHITIGLQMNQQ